MVPRHRLTRLDGNSVASFISFSHCIPRIPWAIARLIDHDMNNRRSGIGIEFHLHALLVEAACFAGYQLIYGLDHRAMALLVTISATIMIVWWAYPESLQWRLLKLRARCGPTFLLLRIDSTYLTVRNAREVCRFWYRLGGNREQSASARPAGEMTRIFRLLGIPDERKFRAKRQALKDITVGVTTIDTRRPPGFWFSEENGRPLHWSLGNWRQRTDLTCEARQQLHLREQLLVLDEARRIRETLITDMLRVSSVWYQLPTRSLLTVNECYSRPSPSP